MPAPASAAAAAAPAGCSPAWPDVMGAECGGLGCAQSRDRAAEVGHLWGARGVRGKQHRQGKRARRCLCRFVCKQTGAALGHLHARALLSPASLATRMPRLLGHMTLWECTLETTRNKTVHVSDRARLGPAAGRICGRAWVASVQLPASRDHPSSKDHPGSALPG